MIEMEDSATERERERTGTEHHHHSAAGAAAAAATAADGASSDTIIASSTNSAPASMSNMSVSNDVDADVDVDADHQAAAAAAASTTISTSSEPENEGQSEHDLLMMPLMMATEDSLTTNNSTNNETASIIRSRKQKKDDDSSQTKRSKRRRAKQRNNNNSNNNNPFWRSTMTVMNFLARLLFWGTVVATVAAVVWYSYELKNNGTDPHLIAWFSAGAFVLLGFPISMYGIVMHLANYNQPNIQMYIVRILWMVPIYSMESWLCLRFHRYAIYIETLRDVYESYVLYSFLQYLIEVLGGEDELILMLKDKSPTRGVHMWGLQYCGLWMKPWLMGQPVSSSRNISNSNSNSSKQQQQALVGNSNNNSKKRSVQWTSPFFVKCKFGVLQYVLLKFVSTIFVMILELNGLYKEGDFTYKGGYLYICILTNLSQCWALYCLIFFYFATKNELSPIRPVGKFLSVKAIVFFTWWQSVCISLIYQMDLIPHYHASNESEWTSEDVAKGLQDYLICIEMFVGAIVHVFVFPHTDYLPQAVQARKQSSSIRNNNNGNGNGTTPRRHLGRRRQYGNIPNRNINHHKTNHHNNHSWLYNKDDFSAASKNSGDVEMANTMTTTMTAAARNGDDDYRLTSTMRMIPNNNNHSLLEEEEDEHHRLIDGNNNNNNNSSRSNNTKSTDGSLKQCENNATASIDNDDDDDDDDVLPDDSEYSADDTNTTPTTTRTGFVKALIESSIPRDVIDQSMGMVKGDYHVEKKTLLHHAATSDQYDLFSSSRRFLSKATKQLEGKE